MNGLEAKRRLERLQSLIGEANSLLDYVDYHADFYSDELFEKVKGILNGFLAEKQDLEERLSHAKVPDFNPDVFHRTLQ